MATPKQAERYHRMLQAAIQEYSQKGYHETSIDTIAKKAKISKATLYHHFGSKEVLFLAVFDHFINKSDVKIFSHILEISDPHEQVRKGIKALMLTVIENKEFYFFFKALTTDINLVKETLRKKIIDKFLASGFFFSRQQIRKLQENGAIKQKFDPDLLFQGSIGLMLSVLTYWEQNQEQITLESCIDHVVEILSVGLFSGEKK
jgi:AcrR family transcriptional regulator